MADVLEHHCHHGRRHHHIIHEQHHIPWNEHWQQMKHKAAQHPEDLAEQEQNPPQPSAHDDRALVSTHTLQPQLTPLTLPLRI